MKLDISKLSVQPTGFGKCGSCAYRETGTPDICYACAYETWEALSTRRCAVCDLPLKNGAACGNPLCSGFANKRQFERNYAIAMRSGILEAAISAYKYDGRKGWAQIFGRVVLGFLEEHRDIFLQFDLVVASPTYVGPASRRAWDHTRLVLQAASAQTEQAWPFDLGEPAVIVKTQDTPAFQSKKWKERWAIAQNELNQALQVPDPSKTTRKRILVYDDIFTDGITLNEVARCLRLQGRARTVCGLTLARQPWRK